MVDDTAFIGNNKIFRLEEYVPKCIYGDNEDLAFCDGSSTLCLFARTEAIGSHNPNDYIGISFLPDGQLCPFSLYTFSPKDMILDEYESIKEGNYLECRNYIYDTDKNMLLSREDIIEKQKHNNDDYGYDDYDYNRDTYYALGGDDYDALKRRGGNADDAIDNLMDYLGY